MAVLKSKRELSKTEYLKILRELEVFIIKRAEKKPRKMDHLFLYDFIETAKNAFNHVVMAYSVIVNCKEDVDLRHRHLMLSYTYIQTLNAQTGIYYDLYRYTPNGLSPAEMRTLSQLIFKAALYLAQEIKESKIRYKSITEEENSKV